MPRESSDVEVSLQNDERLVKAKSEGTIGESSRTSRLQLGRGQRNSVGLTRVHADLEGVSPGVRQRNIEDQHGPGLHIRHPRRWLTELHRSLAIEEFGPRVIQETDPQRVLANLCPPAANPEHQVSPRVHGRKQRYPHMLKETQHGEFSLLVDQGVVGEYREIELQESGHPDRGHYVSLPNLVDYIHPLRDLPEHRMLAIEVGLG